MLIAVNTVLNHIDTDSSAAQKEIYVYVHQESLNHVQGASGSSDKLWLCNWETLNHFKASTYFSRLSGYLFHNLTACPTLT